MTTRTTSARLTLAADRALLLFCAPQRRIGASVMRALLGSAIVLYYMENIAWRRFLWGPQGMVPLSYIDEIAARSGPSLYGLTPSLPYFELLFWTGLVAAAAFACGRWTPFSTVACAVCTWSLIARDNFVTDSGWTLATLLLMYAVVMDCGSYLVAGKALRVRRAVDPSPALRVRAAGVLHNFGVALILWQTSLLYAAACFYKLTGHKWQDGTALYYVLRSNQFDLTALGASVYHSAFLVALATYGTLLLQAAFPFCIWQRPGKYVVALGAVGFHIGIAYCMALPLFSLIMIACEAMLFSDADYRAAYRALQNLATCVARRFAPRALVAQRVPETFADGVAAAPR